MIYETIHPFLLIASVSGATTPQALLPIQIVEAKYALPKKSAKAGQPFYFQRLSIAGQAKLEMNDRELDKFRNSYNLDDSSIFAPYEWVDTADIVGQSSKHRDYVFCSTYLKLGKGVAAACFRDKDSDSRFEAVARFEGGIPNTGLVFQEIAPVKYSFVDNRNYVPPHSIYTVEQFGIGYELDKATGLLRFGIYGGTGYVPLADVVSVDPKTLPTTINIYGAVVNISSWDGKKAIISVDKPLPQTPVRIELPKFKKGKPDGRGHAVFVKDAIIK